MDISQIQFEVGKKYKVTYRIPGVQRYDRYMIAIFLGESGPKAEPEGVTYLFNARPAAGTQELAPRHIQKIEEVPMSTFNVAAARA